jgi:hypothetical protein
MKLTKAATVSFVKQQLGTNPAWAKKALIRIYSENQTMEEKILSETKEDNGIGFSGCDAEIMSSLAGQLIAGNTLSHNQMKIVFRVMPKYAKQVIAFSDANKLTEMVTAAIGNSK